MTAFTQSDGIGRRGAGRALSSEYQPGNVDDQRNDDRYDYQENLAGNGHDLPALVLQFFGAVLDALRALGLFLNERELFALQLEGFLLALDLKFLAFAQLFQDANHSLRFILVHGGASSQRTNNTALVGRTTGGACPHNR
jgi:hypothetical protein